jgi:VIT1/CCC1 family predicted Fe2+/Mn2+ transporter
VAPTLLGTTLTTALAVIALLNFYLAVAKDLSFWRRFGEMAVITLGIAAISFVIGAVIGQVLPVEV